MDIITIAIRNSKYILTGLFLVLFLILAWEKLAFYVRFDFNFILLLIILPIVIRQKNKQKSLRFGIIALALLLIYPFLRLSSVYFFAIVCSLFFLYESQYGKLTSIPLFLVIIVSPVAIFLSEIIGFEIRLYLTEIAAGILSILDDNYMSSGNIIILGGNQFRVDPECMGLRLVLLSLFVILIFIAYQQKKEGKDFHFLSILLSLIAAYILVIISNLFRIILITLFKSNPGSFTHELIGVMSFVIYVVIPSWFIVKALPVKKSTAVETVPVHWPGMSRYIIVAILITSLLFIYRFTSLGQKETIAQDTAKINLDLGNFRQSVEDHGVLKLSNDSLLLYIKPAAGFYSADHSPIICWKGSGYSIEQEQIINISERKVFFSELKQGKDILYTTWWYDCGTEKTISQFRWRVQNLITGRDYRLVNVISYNKQILLMETNELLQKNIFPD